MREPLQGSVLLWPPHPAAESWRSDIPNEGIQVIGEPCQSFDERGIICYMTDYHGHYIIDPIIIEKKHNVNLYIEVVPTQNLAYLDAYRAITKALATKSEWPEQAAEVVAALKLLGWREVEPFEEDGKMFRWKSPPVDPSQQSLPL